MKLFKWLDRLAGLEGIDELHEQAKRQLEDARKQLRVLSGGTVLFPATPLPGLPVGAMHYGSGAECAFDECAVCAESRAQEALRAQQLLAQQQAQFLASMRAAPNCAFPSVCNPSQGSFNMNSLSGQ